MSIGHTRILGAMALALGVPLVATPASAINTQTVTCYEDDNTVSPPSPPGNTCPYVNLESLDPLPTSPTNLLGNADPVIRWQSGSGSSATMWLAYSYPAAIKRTFLSPWVVSVETHYMKTTNSGGSFGLSSGPQPSGQKMKLVPYRWDKDPRVNLFAPWGVTNSETYNLAKVGNGKWVGVRDKYWHKESQGKVYTSERLELVMADSVDGIYTQVMNPSTTHRQLLTGTLGAPSGIGTCGANCNGVANFEDNKGTGGSMGTGANNNFSVVDLTALGGNDTADCSIWLEPGLYYHTDNRLYLSSHCFALGSGSTDLSKSDTFLFRSQANPDQSHPNQWTWSYVGRLYGQTEAVALKDAGRIEAPDDELTFTATDIVQAADGSIIAITAPNFYPASGGEANNGHFGCHVFKITDITTASIERTGGNTDLPVYYGRIDTPSLMPDGYGWDGGTHNGANLSLNADPLGNSTCSYDYRATGSTVSGIIEAYKYHETDPYFQNVFMHNTKWRP
ncbi:MAG: hypothetical protein H6923_00855 [Alphaproteobacteria bacterium]|nr:hypothetical protein [Alphaproteobacteria bacterium]